MQRAIDLAKMGGKRVAPNPFVGSVLVFDGRIIGEGYHEYYGGPHAEVNCIKSVKAVDLKFIKESTLYVTLEPCCFHGKTPACTDLIIESKIPKVVVSSIDPNKKVAGKGIDILKENGVEVTQGILNDKSDLIIRPFRKYLKEMPYIILKVVKSSDGFIGSKSRQIWISNPLSKRLSHKWRSEVHGIMVGSNTVLIDNPSLTNRLWSGGHPIRVIWDRNLKIANDLVVFDDSSTTVILNELKDEKRGNILYINIIGKTLVEVCQLLFNLGVYTLLVEGGSATIKHFYIQGIWDEARIITSLENISSSNNDDLIGAVNVLGRPIQKFTLDSDRVEILSNINA
jgi:diaminohydroxyphosphoribosylaminopyrimidine deaminase/5-amino-6-(5-phosphoribosylamino)uracil reductase